jgi:hypothetical protein
MDPMYRNYQANMKAVRHHVALGGHAAGLTRAGDPYVSGASPSRADPLPDMRRLAVGDSVEVIRGTPRHLGMKGQVVGFSMDGNGVDVRLHGGFSQFFNRAEVKKLD